MTKATPNRFYRIRSSSFILWVGPTFDIGFGITEKEALHSEGRHNHWLKEGNKLPGNVSLIRLKSLSNK